MNLIGDYAMIGDCHSLALVGMDGSIDWACFPRFDSPSVFCRILDEERGGHFAITPQHVIRVRRAYVEDTNVLTTTFECAGGELELTDCMPVVALDRDDPTMVATHHEILRRLRCTRGSVEVQAELAPRFEYGAFAPRFMLPVPTRAEIVGGADALWVNSTHPLANGGNGRIHAVWNLTGGEEAWMQVAWTRSHEPAGIPDRVSVDVFNLRLEETIGAWRSWIGRCWYDGDYREAVHRSALVLKALTYAPSGALVAAGTTSLPEQIGGSRNWDYRYTWIRDATLTLTSLFILGLRGEADAFKGWLERAAAGRADELQIMYGIGGEHLLTELELSHLAGHRASGPVRIGNGAATQVQLDAYGQILQAAFLYAKAGGEFTAENWRFVSRLADIVCLEWRKPDHGIWEMRDEPRHFVHSKLNCWVALDRAVRMAAAGGLPGAVDRWTREREALRSYLMEAAQLRGWFPQAVGDETADASTLLVPAFGFLPTTHPLVAKTIDVVRSDLERNGLIYRYLSPDGIEGGEGVFLLCSFWLLDCLTHSGRLDEAEALLERLLGLANDVGLFSEEADPDTGEHLGNFPQAFTHMALVSSCAYLSAARHGEIRPNAEHDYAELALDRLLAAQGRARP